MFPCGFRSRNCKSARDVLDPEQVPYLEATTGEVILPREAMGLGDVKFMAAIGAFLGWPGVVFSLGVSSLIGSVVGVRLIACEKTRMVQPAAVRALYRAGRGHLGIFAAHFREMWPDAVFRMFWNPGH